MNEIINQLIDLIINAKLPVKILLGVFLFTFVVQLVYYIFIYARFIFYKKESYEIYPFPVSVVICARNEAENLRNFLPSILEQDYPRYEVIVVNDCSVDDSDEILANLKKKYAHLYATKIELDNKFRHGKKLALTIGVKAAKYEWLLLTDADCMADSDKWLKNMQQNFMDNRQIVLGYGGYLKEKGLLNKFVRFDAFFTAWQYFSFALAGFPYMGVGRNLAYRKALFFKNKGFAAHKHIDSGDDDLFVNANATKANTIIEFSEDSHTRSKPKQSFAQWVSQKRRHYTSSKLYKRRHKILLSGEVASRLLFYASFGVLLYFNFLIEYIAGIFVFRLLLQMIFANKAMNRLKEKDLFVFWLLFDLVLPLVNSFIFATNIFYAKKFKWK